jgi:hypothetical protein
MKKIETVAKEYVSKLPYDNLKYLYDRFDERIGPDLSEAIEFIAKNVEIDKFLAAAKNGEELFATMDKIAEAVEKEFTRRTPELSHA